MRVRVAVFLMGLTSVAACHYRPAPVTLAGDPASVRALAGTWVGTYVGTDSRRTGSITFTIRVEGDSAFGDVLMEQPPGLPVIRTADDPASHALHARTPQLLAVRFVSVAAGEVSGTLEPYVAPDCDCTVETQFTGLIRADTVRGTFVTRGRLIAPQTGVWGVRRKP